MTEPSEWELCAAKDLSGIIIPQLTRLIYENFGEYVDEVRVKRLLNGFYDVKFTMQIKEKTK